MEFEGDPNDDMLPEYPLDYGKAKPNRFADSVPPRNDRDDASGRQANIEETALDEFARQTIIDRD